MFSGITDWAGGVWDLLTGKPQSWYDRIDRDQKALAVRSAEINAIGQEAWDSVRDSYLATTQGPDVDFLSYGEIQNGIVDHLRYLVVTSKHAPSDQDISGAEAYNAQYGRYVDYVKTILPELASAANASAAEVTAALSRGSLLSPSAVGKQVFVDELERRAALLGAGVAGGILTYLLIAAAVSAVVGGMFK